MEWPPFSPNMNPIEHLLFLPKEAVCKVNPDVKKVGGNDKNVRQAPLDELSKHGRM